MRRWAGASSALALLACNAHLGALPDAAAIRDASRDGAPCTGGDTHASDGTTCFQLFATPKIWLDAKAACESVAGRQFAKILDASQNALVASLAQGHDTFLGGTDAAMEGTWLWADGTPITYTNWRVGEPSNGGAGGTYVENCLVIEGSKTPDDTWDDRPCDPSQVATSGSFPFICSY